MGLKGVVVAEFLIVVNVPCENQGIYEFTGWVSRLQMRKERWAKREEKKNECALLRVCHV